MILSPYIDLRYPILETFGDYLNYHCRGFREEVFVFTLDYLGWGRCGLHGEGSSVVGVGEDLVQGDDPVGPKGRGERGGCDPSGGGSCFRGRGGQPGVLAGLLS